LNVEVADYIVKEFTIEKLLRKMDRCRKTSTLWRGVENLLVSCGKPVDNLWKTRSDSGVGV